MYNFINQDCQIIQKCNKIFFLKLILKLIYVLFSEQSGEKILCFNVRCPNVPAKLRRQKRMFRRVVIGHTTQGAGIIMINYILFHLKNKRGFCFVYLFRLLCS